MNEKSSDNHMHVLSEISSYYSNKLVEHGSTPRGVDWNGTESQMLRFEQLCKIIDKKDHFSINDLGCGYGALLEFISKKYTSFNYIGIDISPEMIQSAKNRTSTYIDKDFLIAHQPNTICDYGIASGIFNVRLNNEDDEWEQHLISTLDILNKTSNLGFSFNCLTSYSDEEKKRNYLYYANPSWIFNLCKERYSRNVALLHDYDLYEFTVLVRKST